MQFYRQHDSALPCFGYSRYLETNLDADPVLHEFSAIQGKQKLYYQSQDVSASCCVRGLLAQPNHKPPLA